MAFADHAAAMDAQVDTRLGDSILYRRHEDPADLALFAFVLRDEPPEGWSGLDSSKPRIRLKISKVALGRRPSINDRVTSTELDGTYRPTNNNAVSAGRYWLADLQRV